MPLQACCLVISLSAAIIILSVAEFGCQVRYLPVQGRAVRGIEVTIAIVVQVAGISQTVRIEVELLRIRDYRAVVFAVGLPVPIEVVAAILRAGARVLTCGLVAIIVAAGARSAIGRASGQHLGESAHSVTAEAAVRRARRRGLPPVANCISTRGHTILPAVPAIFVLTADSIPAQSAVLWAVPGAFPCCAQPVSAGRSAVHRT